MWKNYIKVIVVNILDIITTFVYIGINPQAQELSPVYGLGLWQFLLLKSVLIPLLFWFFKWCFDVKDAEEFAIFIFIFYGFAVINNLINIARFIY